MTDSSIEEEEYTSNNEWRSSMGFPIIEDDKDYCPVYPPKAKVSPVVGSVTKKHKAASTSSVNDYILLSKKSDQSTLTQIYKRAPTSPLEDSDDDFVTKKRKPKVTPDRSYSARSPPKKRSKSHKRNKVPDLAQFGDLVSSSAKELNHPRYLSGDVDPGYFLFGVVRGGDEDTVMVAWNNIEPALKDAGSAKVDMKLMDYVSRNLVRVVGKYDDSKLIKMNNFIRATIYHEFTYKKGVGWVKFAWV